MILAAVVLALAVPHLTPGETRRPPLTVTRICAIKWGLDRRHVTIAMKRYVMTAYGVRWEDRGQYEIDHLVPRELGGADHVLNLWPQPLSEARVKDREENRLHRAVCRGTVTLAAAQRQMRRWGQEAP